MKCDKCEDKATHDAPRAYCTYHWCEWWFEKYNREELLEQVADLMDKLYGDNNHNSGGLV